MFAIYTPNGRTFSGTLEGLRQIEKSNRVNVTNKHQFLDDLQEVTGKKYQVTTTSVNAYKKAIKKQDEIAPIHHAYQIMTSPVEVLRGDDSLAVAIDKLKNFSYQVFPVVDSRGQLMGTLSRQHIYEYILRNKTVYHEKNKHKTLAELFLNEKSKAYSAEPVTDIRRIAALFIENKLNSICIIESTGKIVGIVSRTDIVNATIKEPPLSLWC